MQAGVFGRSASSKTARWFGYLVTLMVDCDHELPVSFEVSPAIQSELTKLPKMFDDLREKHRISGQ
jgi:hypothetical protein